jgi:hypothetical protein
VRGKKHSCSGFGLATTSKTLKRKIGTHPILDFRFCGKFEQSKSRLRTLLKQILGGETPTNNIVSEIHN